MAVKIKNERDDSVNRESSNRNIQGVIAKRKPVFARLVFEDRLVVGTKDFCEQVHACLRQENGNEPKPEGVSPKRFAKIVCDACAKEVRQRGEEKLKRAGESKKITDHDMYECSFLDFMAACKKTKPMLCLNTLLTFAQLVEG